MTRKEEIEKRMEEVGRLFYIYDRDYVDEWQDACDQWNELINIMKNEGLDINWRQYR